MLRIHEFHSRCSKLNENQKETCHSTNEIILSIFIKYFVNKELRRVRNVFFFSTVFTSIDEIHFCLKTTLS